MCGICASKSEKQLYPNSLDTYAVWAAKGEKYALMDMDARRAAVKEDAQEDKGGEEFLPQELIIAAALGLAFYDVGTVGAQKMYDILEAEGLRGLDKAIDAAEPYFQQVFAYKDTAERVRGNLQSAMLVGGDAAGSRQLLKDVFRINQILEEMVDATKYFTNSYFNTQVVPDLRKIVQAIVDNPDFAGQTDTAAYQAIRGAMDARLKSVPHWRVVANAAASRGYHYGAVKAGMIVGQRAYKIVAVLDSATSEICKHMNGKEFWLADAEEHVNKSALAEGEDIKTVAPWLPAKDVLKMSGAQLKEAGFICPPFHGNCRSTIQFI